MATLETQYRDYLKSNDLLPESCTYECYFYENN